MGDEGIREEGVLEEEVTPEGPGTPEPGPEEEPEPTEAEEAEPSEEDEPEPDEDQPIPLKRLNKEYAKRKALERERDELAQKMNLFQRLGPEKYYEVYPDERPTQQRETRETPQPSQVPTFSQCLGLRVQGGQFDGYTLEQLWASEDANIRAAAMDYYTNYRDTVKTQVDQVRAKEIETKTAIEQEHNQFFEGRAQELFGKDANTLSSAELGKIHNLVNTLLDRMESGELRTYDLNTAYKLATLDDQIKDAKGKSVKALVEAMRKAGSVTKPELKPDGGAKASSYDGFMSYTADQLAAHLNTLNSEEIDVFWKKAPDSLKKRFPSAAAAYA